MFYSFMRGLVRLIIGLINGKPHYQGRENLPQGAYILVGPHRTWFDPLLYALAGSPMQFSFMAKEELFKNPVLRFILIHANAFPVNRAHPGPSAIKTPVKFLRSGKLSLIMFPSGTRHSQELKGGATVIAKMAKVPLVPTVYQGPLTFKQLFTRQRITIRFGKPIYIDRHLKLDDVGQKQVETTMLAAFDTLDHAIDPNFHYVDPATKKHAN